MKAGAKIGREFQRLRRQLGGAHWYLSGGWQRRRYDARRAETVRVSEGNAPWRDEAAIVLLYQPAGISAATLFTLSWLRAGNVAAVAVSNLPLATGDRELLQRHCSLVIERPNLGYDFGGYREGIMTLIERGLPARALYVMNDSIWFPLRESTDVLQRARACPSDLYGLLCNEVTRGGKRRYLQSYFFRFGRLLLHSKEFRDYWRHLPLMNDKHQVVHRCERRLTGHFTDRGFSLGFRHHSRDLTEALLALDDDGLADAARFMMDAGGKDRARLAPLLGSSLPFAQIRPDIEALIRDRRVQSTFSAAHPGVLMQMGVPFLKKADTEPLRAQRRWLVKLGLAAELAAPIRAEILDCVRRDPAAAGDDAEPGSR